MDLKTWALLCILYFEILTTDCSPVLKTGGASVFIVYQETMLLVSEFCNLFLICFFFDFVFFRYFAACEEF